MIKALCAAAAVYETAAHSDINGHGLLGIANPSDLGFEPVPYNLSYKRVPLAVNGTVPTFLKGTLYRGAPGAWPDGWWLDGLLTIHGFKFEAGQVYYTMQWNKDQVYNRTVAGKPPLPPLDRPEFTGAIPHAANTSFPTGVAFRQIQDSLCTSTGVSSVNHLDWDTLEPVAMPLVYDDDLRAPYLAPTHAAETQDGYILHHVVKGIQKAKGGGIGTPSYVVTSMKPGSKTREVIATIERPRAASWLGAPSFQHMTMATQNYYVMLESNCYYPETLTQVGVVNWAGWESNLLETAHVRLVSRSSGESTVYPLAYNIFAIHHLNVFEDPGTNTVVFDTIQLFPSFIPCSIAFEGTKMPVLESGFAGIGYKMSKALRLTLPLDKPGSKVHPQLLLGNLTGLEFPTLRGQDYGKDYTYAYAMYISNVGTPFYDALIKTNMKDGTYVTWKVEGHFPGEPIFVADPDGKSDDDGVVVTNVLDSVNKITYMVVLDAKTMTEKARVGPTPHVIPHGFHGRYFEKPSSADASTNVIV